MLNKNVLVTGTGGCGVGEGIFKSLTELQEYNVFTCNSSDNSLFVFDNPERSFIVPKAVSVNYFEVLIEICKEHQIGVIVPGSEQELVVFVNQREQFTAQGITIFANTSEVIGVFDNKWETFLKLRQLGINTPDTCLDGQDASFFFERNQYPIIIKPVYGNASKNVFIINNKEEYNCISQYLRLKKIQFVIQEYVGTSEEEFTISVLSDFNGNYLGSIVLKRILAGGFSQFIECEEFKELDNAAIKIAEQIHSKGPLNIQCRLYNGKLSVFEINPRFSGTTPFRTLLGFNEFDILFKKTFEGVNIFKREKLKLQSFGVRGFQEKIYEKKIKTSIKIYQ